MMGRQPHTHPDLAGGGDGDGRQAIPAVGLPVPNGRVSPRR
jgi:hypothetical protein